jgi:hypothetical protein
MATETQGRQTGTGPRQVGKRVFVRPPVRQDEDEFLALMRASARLYRGLLTPIRSAEQLGAYIKRCAQSDFEGLLDLRT